MNSEADPDARPPVPPDKPLPAECCESGCEVCVFDAYAEALAAYRRALERWRRLHPEEAEDRR